MTAPGTRGACTVRRGGVPGVLGATAPTVAFVVANAIGGLTRALLVLVLTAVVVFGARVARREPLRTVAAGVVVAAVSALTAALTGEARGFFLLPILMPAVLTVVCLVTVATGRPVTGLLFNRVANGPPDWPRHRRLRRVHTLSTLAAALVNAGSVLIQAVFYLDDQPVALAVAHFAVWPVFATLVATTLFAARRAGATSAARG